MKKFLAIYTASPAGMEAWRSLDEAARRQKEQAGAAAWKEWATAHQDAIAEQGNPLGKTKRITADGIADTRNAMTAYTVVEAESHEAAAKLFQQHPHFTIFPGDGVEVMECLPLPEGA